MRFFSYLIFSAVFFATIFLLSTPVSAGDIRELPKQPDQNVYFSPSTGNETDASPINVIDRAVMPNYGKELSEITNKNVFTNNVNFTYDHFQLDAPAYLKFPIMDIVNEGFLVKIAPTKYSTFDMQSRSNAPIDRLNGSVKMNKSFYTDDSDFITGALFNFIFGALTKNIFSMNFNFLALADNPNGVNMNFVLKPLKNLMFKFSRIEMTEDKQSIFEIQIVPTQTTLLTLKTSDSGKNTSTGIEFEMKF